MARTHDIARLAAEESSGREVHWARGRGDAERSKGEHSRARVPDTSTGRIYGVPLEPSWAVRRPALVRRIEERHTVTVVRGGSGFGKTMLVSQWASAHGAAGVWVDVDSDVVERRSFWARVFGLIADSGAEVVDPCLLPTSDEVLSGDVRRLVVRFASRLEADFVLVVDGAQRLEDTGIEDDLLAMLRMTERLRVVILTRGTSSFERRDDASPIDVLEVEPRMLLFSPRECALVIVRSVLTVDAELAEEVHSITGGMPLATRLVAEMLDGPNRLSTPAEKDALTTRVADALIASAGGAADATDPEFFDFLKRAALLDSVTASEAARLGGVDLDVARARLDRARSLGLGFWESDGNLARFHFIPITARVLDRSATAPDRSNAGSAEAAAAEVVWSRGDARAAWARAVRTEQFSLAERILRESFTIVADDEPAAFEPLLAVPTTKLRRFPFLMAVLGIAHSTSGKGRGVGAAYLSAAEQFARSRPSEVGVDERLAMLSVRLVSLRFEGRWAAALSVASDAYTSIERAGIDERPPSPGVLCATLLNAGVTFLGAGHYASAVRVTERALSIPGLRSENLAEVHAVLAAAHATAGSIPTARSHIASATADATTRPSSWAAYASILECVERGDAACTRPLLAQIERTGGVEVRTRLLPVRAVLDATDGHALTTMSSVTDALSDRDRLALPPSVRSDLSRAAVVLSLAVGALAHAKSAARSFDKADPTAAVARAQIALIEDKPLDAVAITSESLTAASLRVRTRIELLLARAAASLRLGGERASLHDLAEALRLIEAKEPRSPWSFLIEADRQSLEGLAERTSLASATLIGKLSATPVLFTPLDSFVELTAREREVLTLLVSGMSISAIAGTLVVSPNTVKKQRASIYRKLGATTREEAAIAAIARGLLDA